MLRALSKDTVRRCFFSCPFANFGTWCWDVTINLVHLCLMLTIPWRIHCFGPWGTLRIIIKEHFFVFLIIFLLNGPRVIKAISNLFWLLRDLSYGCFVVLTRWYEGADLATALQHWKLLLHVMTIKVNLGQLFLFDPPCNIVSNLV